MVKIDLHGLGVALITPFKEDESVDYEALTRIIKYLLKNRTDYIVALGTTAETPCLFEEEKKEITRHIIEQVNGRVPIVLGIGGNCTKATIEQINRTDLAGISALLSVVPYYNKPSQEGIYQHYEAIAKEAPLPVVIYNVPGRTGINMTAETTLRIANDLSNVVAVKEASGNLAQIGEIIKNKPDGFEVISGDDGLTLQIIELGGIGVISVSGNAFPMLYGSMVHEALKGNFKAARFLNEYFKDIYELLFVDGSPAGIKSMMYLLKFIENKLRLPLVPTRDETFGKIRNALTMLGDSLKNDLNK